MPDAPDAARPPAAGQGWTAPPGGWQVPPEVTQAQPAAAGWGAAPPGQAWAPQPPRPGIVPLRPLTVGELLDGGIQAVRRHPRAMLGLSLVVVTVTEILSTALTASSLVDSARSSADVGSGATTVSADLHDVLPAVAGSLLAVPVSVLGTLVLVGLLTVLVSRLVIGEKATVGEAWTAAKSRLLPLVGLALTATAVTVVLAAVAVGVPVLVQVVGRQPWLTVAVGLVVGAGTLVLGVRLVVLFALAAPVLVLERAGVVTALRRSRTLSRGSFWRTFWILLLTVVLVTVAQTVIAVPFSLVAALSSGFTGGGTADAALLVVGTTLLNILVGCVTYPFLAAVLDLVYVDLRMRKEGLDLVLARAAAASATAPLQDQQRAGGHGSGGGWGGEQPTW